MSEPDHFPERPEPRYPDPFVRSDPFWGDTPTWVATVLIIGYILALFIVSLAVGLALT